MNIVWNTTPAACEKLEGIIDLARLGDQDAKQLVDYAPAAVKMATELVTTRTLLTILSGALPAGHGYVQLIEIHQAKVDAALGEAGLNLWAGAEPLQVAA